MDEVFRQQDVRDSQDYRHVSRTVWHLVAPKREQICDFNGLACVIQNRIGNQSWSVAGFLSLAISHYLKNFFLPKVKQKNRNFRVINETWY